MTDEYIEEIFRADGLLAQALDGYEKRDAQVEMARQVFDTYTHNRISLMEGGTGTGKSLAYLIPAVIWALKHQEKTVISTHTIALQEQLIKRDIPFLLSLLDLDMKAMLVKGMGNYLCKRRLEQQRDYANFTDEGPAFQKLEVWAESTREGSKSEIRFPLPYVVWDAVKAENHSCNHVKCAHYKSCFFFNARKKVDEAQILVVNHHLLFADLIHKREEDDEQRTILPKSTRVTIDEAHHIEEIATQALSKRADRYGFIRLLGMGSGQVGSSLDALVLILKAMPNDRERDKMKAHVEETLIPNSTQLFRQMEKVFTSLEYFLSAFDAGSGRLVVDQSFQQSSRWNEEVSANFETFGRALFEFSAELKLLYAKLEKDDEEKLQALGHELKATDKQIGEYCETLQRFFDVKEQERVKWIERRGESNVALVNCCLNVAPHLEEVLFDSHLSVNLCSATLTTGSSFDFTKERLGISHNERVTEAIYHSPFDYETQALFGAPSDICEPIHPNFTKEAAEVILSAIRASRGSAFILFTSYEMLRQVYELLIDRAEEEGFHFLKQGDASRHHLIQEFKENTRSVLFGTDSFWEGIDVAGDDLHLVVLVKIPFKVPSDPLVKAHQKLLIEKRKDPFNHYTIPHAVVKFKQGFGRLIRKATDRGSVLCLDKRLFTKGYGKAFLNSLPECKKLYKPTEELIQEMKQLWSVAGSNR